MKEKAGLISIYTMLVVFGIVGLFKPLSYSGWALLIGVLGIVVNAYPLIKRCGRNS